MKRKREVSTPMRRPAASGGAATQAAADLQAALAALAASNDLIQPYLNVPRVPHAKVRNRVHAKAWHMAVDWCGAKGMSHDEAKAEGRKFAAIQVDRWKAATGKA